MNILAEVSLTPLDKGESVGSYIAPCVEIIDRSGLEYQLGPMGTCIEGEWDEVMMVIKKCFEGMRNESRRISISVKIDYREGKMNRLRGKVDDVEKLLGHTLKK